MVLLRKCVVLKKFFESNTPIYNTSLTRDFVYFVDNGIVKVKIDAAANNTTASDVTPTIRYGTVPPNFKGFVAVKENVPTDKYSSGDETISNEIYLLNERQDSGSKTGVFKGMKKSYIRDSGDTTVVSTTLIKAFRKKLIIYKDAADFGELFLSDGSCGTDERVQSLRITGEFNTTDQDELFSK